MARSYIPVYFDLLEEAQELTDQEFGRMIRAAIMYARGIPDYMDNITGNERFVFRFLVGQIDRNNAISDARAKAGANKRMQNETNANKTKQTRTKKESKADNGLFERFWNEYPRKVNKPGAQKAFLKINPDEALVGVMLAAITKQKASSQWQESQYIPHPATWLNGHRWEDEVKPMSAKTVSAQQYEQRDYSNVQDEIVREQEAEIREFLKRKEEMA